MELRSRWIEAGYLIFSERGPKGLSLRELSFMTKLPEANFHKNFKGHHAFENEIVKLHLNLSHVYFDIVKNHLINFLPDIHMLNMQNITGLKFSKQVFLNRDRPKFNELYLKLIQLGNPVFIPKMLDFYDLTKDYFVAESLWMTVYDAWFARLDTNQLNVTYLSDLTESIMKPILDLTHFPNSQ